MNPDGGTVLRGAFWDSIMAPGQLCRIALASLLSSVVAAEAMENQPLTLAELEHWPQIRAGTAVSCNGSVIACSISEGAHTDRWTLKLSARDGSWYESLGASTSYSFSADGKIFVYRNAGGILCLRNVVTQETAALGKTRQIRFPQTSDNAWVAFTLEIEEPEALHLRRLSDGTEKRFPGVTSYKFSSRGNYVAIAIKSINSSGSRLLCIDLSDGNELWSLEGGYFDSLSFDRDDSALGFCERDNASAVVRSIGLCRTASGAPAVTLPHLAERLPAGKIVARQSLQVAPDVEHVLFSLADASASQNGPKKDEPADVKIFSYMDPALPGQILLAEPSQQLVSWSTKTDRIEILTTPGENLSVRSLAGHHLLLELSGGGDEREGTWNPLSPRSFLSISLRDGFRRQITRRESYAQNCLLSPSGRWALFNKIGSPDLFSCDLESGEMRNLTAGLDANWELDNNGQSQKSYAYFERVQWAPDERHLVVRDRYDLWLLDPSRATKPINLTNGYGSRTGTSFRILPLGDSNIAGWSVIRDRLLLWGVDEDKNTGFYECSLTGGRDPGLLSSGAYMYNYPPWGREPRPLQIGKSDEWVLPRSSATEEVNLFSTRDFRRFDRLTAEGRGKDRRWLKCELMVWTDVHKKKRKALLYTPENLEAGKKYPVIISCYERKTEGKNRFLRPAFCADEINIPYFVSNGYIVLAPDIDYEFGAPGTSSLQALESAVVFLKGMAFVDGEKIGAHGHSFGAYEVNYAISHSNLFAAACSASGASDLMTLYTSGMRAGYQMYHAESGQGRMGGTPWELPQSYLSQSPLWQAPQIVTPLLIMCGGKDNIVPANQGAALFRALRRLRKPVWMLEYEDGGHSLSSVENLKDYTLRLKDFFDYHLKNGSRPKWMDGSLESQVP